MNVLSSIGNVPVPNASLVDAGAFSALGNTSALLIAIQDVLAAITTAAHGQALAALDALTGGR